MLSRLRGVRRPWAKLQYPFVHELENRRQAILPKGAERTNRARRLCLSLHSATIPVAVLSADCRNQPKGFGRNSSYAHESGRTPQTQRRELKMLTNTHHMHVEIIAT